MPRPINSHFLLLRALNRVIREVYLWRVLGTVIIVSAHSHSLDQIVVGVAENENAHLYLAKSSDGMVVTKQDTFI